MNTEKCGDTIGEVHEHGSRSSSDTTFINPCGFEGGPEKSNNGAVAVEGEKAEGEVENGSLSQPEKSSGESAENLEGEDDDCKIIESPSPSCKEFKLKQTRVHDWVQSTSQTSYKDKPSFKHNLPHWVDQFDNFFTFISQYTDARKKPIYVFRCKLCVGVARKKNNFCRVRNIGNFMAHLKVNDNETIHEILDLIK